MKTGDRVRIVGRSHPWKGASGTITGTHRQHGLDWVLRLDEPWGSPGVYRQSCVASSEIRPLEQERQRQETLL